MFELDGKVALVTGAGQNIGEGISHALARQGAIVAVNDYHPERAQRVVDDINAAGRRAIAAPFDVTDLPAVTDAFAKVTEQVGPVDILINGAGNGGPGEQLHQYTFREMPIEYWQTTISVNLFGVLNCCKAAIGSMADRGWGRIVTLSSGAGETGLNLGVSTYGAAKGGATAFMRHLAVENAAQGVTANTIALGMVLKDTTGVAEMAAAIPAGRVGRPEDVGALAVYLVSPEASWITGQTINLNGGAFIK
ncbi:SDR family oxidoreductase [Mycobacterium sp. TNTM28]|uniref:SDR family oxidoreductase n=1 Tax=[Mycobacterium] fortunisiensis TaxID=2600579 RepID=A0ABS6KT08_9MYCO|nr:SDR family NAD(P)-dependent oxidoreductase [[Mycobacterium] fortunisiensis]MBU9766712.1 SDR family oxidoreductase [[Mycobacterium] fortunisiensis]